MINKFLPIAILGAALISNTGCKNEGGFKKINGIEYKIVKDAPGKNAAYGDIDEFHILAKADTMVLGDSRKQNNDKPAVIRVDSVKGSGQWLAVLPLLSAGDSVLIEISCDTLIKETPEAQRGQLPPWMKKGKKITISLSVISVKSMADYQKEADAKKMEQVQAEDKTLQDYFAKNNIKAQKTEKGVYYTIEKEGTGATIAAGQTVSMKYTGKTLDGHIFDTNRDTTFKHTDALTFTVGARQMIPGMDDGVTVLKKGSKATLYLPSPLAYGEQGPPGIGANAILIFDVDITDVKAGAPAAQMQQGPPTSAQ